jgi:kynurenine formamidase
MEKNNLVFLSHPYTPDTPSYGNRDMVKISSNSSIKVGETANTSTWIFTNNHIGTHIDVPYHFDENGKKVTNYEAKDWFFSEVGLVDIPCTSARQISEKEIEKFNLSTNIEILLIRTGFENFRNKDSYWNDNPGLSSSLPGYLRKTFPKLRCVGFDFISITSWKHREEGRKSHKAFLSPEVGERPILAIEDMSLKKASNNINWLIVSPLLVENSNGAPVTVIASQK